MATHSEFIYLESDDNSGFLFIVLMKIKMYSIDFKLLSTQYLFSPNCLKETVENYEYNEKKQAWGS